MLEEGVKEELWAVDEVAPPEFPRLRRQPPGPLEPGITDPLRCPRDLATSERR